MSISFSNKKFSNFITVFRILTLEIVVCCSFIIFIHDKTNIVSFFYGVFWFILLFIINFIIFNYWLYFTQKILFLPVFFGYH